MTVIWAIVILGVIVGTGYYAFGLYSAWAFCRPGRRTAGSGATPPVTILKPLKGPGLDLEANLESFCALDYPDYQMLFAVADPRDPAVEVVERIKRRHPDLDMELIVDPTKLGTNRKVSSLIHTMPFAKHDILVLSDGDIRVPRDYLKRIVEPLEDPHVGLVTSLYRAVPPRCLPTRVAALYINTDFMPMVFVARLVERFRYAFGATIALRRAALDAIGGFAAIKDHLADDAEIGYLITEKGYTVALSPLVVETHLERETLPRLASEGQLMMYRHTGFWRSMDTFKEAIELDAIWRESAPWKVWADDSPRLKPGGSNDPASSLKLSHHLS